MANQESLLRTAQECLKLAPQSEPAKADLARVENDLRSAKAQQLLWSAEVARLEARLKEQPTPSPDLVVKVFALRYAQASEAAATLQPLLASDFKIVADTRTNALLVHGPESKFAALEEVIRKLDAVTTNSPSPGKKP